MTCLYLCLPRKLWCVSSMTFSLLYEDICLVEGCFAHFLLFLLRSHFLLCNLLFSVHHTASQVVKSRSRGDSHHSAFSQLPRNSVGPLGVPPKPGSSWWLQAQCPGKGSSQLSPLASRNFLCLLTGPAIRGPSDSDAVFHLRRDRDAGRTAPQAPLLYLPLLSQFPPSCS